MYASTLKETCQERSVETTEGRLGRFFAPVLEDLAKLDEAGAKRLYEQLRERPTARGTPISVQDHRHCLSRAKALGRYLKGERLWTCNPLKRVKAIGKPKRGEESKPQHNHDERDQLILAALDLGERGDAGAAAVLCGQLGGLRASTIANRQRRHFDKRGTVLWATAKGKTVPLSLVGRDEQAEAILSRFRKVLALQAKDKLPEAPLIGTGHDRWWVRRQTHRICDLAKVSRVTAHALRGSHISGAYEEGESPAAVARSVGHSHESTGQRHYATAAAQAQGGMARALNSITLGCDSQPRIHNPFTTQGDQDRAE